LQFHSRFGSVYYELHGSKESPALVFTHGGGLNGRMFSEQIAAFEGGYRILNWDMPGHGRSSALTEAMDLWQTAECLTDLMARCGLSEAVLVGQSMGVWVNQFAALDQPHLARALVSIGGGPINQAMAPRELFLYRTALRLSRLLPANLIFTRAAREKTVTEDARNFYWNSMHAMGKQQFLWMLAGTMEACARPAEKGPEQPISIIHGEHEQPRSLLNKGRAWHDSLENSHFEEIPRAGHNANMDNPEAFNRSLERFLTAVEYGRYVS